MTATTWTMRLARMLGDELANVRQAELEHIADCEPRAIDYDGGVGLAAIAACAARPPGPARDAEVATWGRRLAETPYGLAVVITADMSDDEVQVIARLAYEMRRERSAKRTS